MNHSIVSRVRVGNLELNEIEKSKVVKVSIENGIDTGYHKFGTRWWENAECPASYSYLDLDSLYPSDYFDSHGHPSLDDSSDLYNYMQEIYFKVKNKKFKSIFEIGGGGGNITSIFRMNKIQFLTIEGTEAGVEKLINVGIAKRNIIKQNIKFYDYKIKNFTKTKLKKYDLTMCTEVAEHIEPWFASKVVELCTKSSNFVWFSAAKGDAPAHYHHMNEIRINAWDNLFAQFGFCFHIELDGRFNRADRLYIAECEVKNIKKFHNIQ